LAAQSPDEQSAELDGSKRWLEDFLGHPVSSFSYPYGGRPEHYVDATVDAVRRAGFSRACTTAPRPVRRRDSPWEWGRFHVADMDGDQFQRFLES
jgi:peptidoglycan/xylan/chitin deacetylase (PgdA/CDA1 family)